MQPLAARGSKALRSPDTKSIASHTHTIPGNRAYLLSIGSYFLKGVLIGLGSKAFRCFVWLFLVYHQVNQESPNLFSHQTKKETLREKKEKGRNMEKCPNYQHGGDWNPEKESHPERKSSPEKSPKSTQRSSLVDVGRAA